MSRNEKIAREAIAYARSFIVFSGTSLEINDRDEVSFKNIRLGTNEVRAAKASENMDRLDENEDHFKFDKKVQLTRKFSLGNCHEYAYLALEYISLHTNLYAEIISIESAKGIPMEGDHVFVAIKEKNSDPTNPAKWGKDAYICDPWSNKAYLAKDYLTELQNYFDAKPIFGIFKNCVTNFNPKIYFLAAEECSRSDEVLSTDFIRMREKQDYLRSLKENFLIKTTLILEALSEFKSKLKSLQQTFKNQSDQINEKIIEVKALIDICEKIKKTNWDISKKSYSEVKDMFQSLLQKLIRKFARLDKQHFKRDEEFIGFYSLYFFKSNNIDIDRVAHEYFKDLSLELERAIIDPVKLRPQF